MITYIFHNSACGSRLNVFSLSKKIYGVSSERIRGPPYLFDFQKNQIDMEDFFMSENNQYININGIKVPVSKEVYEYYNKSERKLTYAEKDRKQERTRIDKTTGRLEILPSLEDSVDRLTDKDVQFVLNQPDIFETVANKLLVEYLMSQLTEDEKDLIIQIYFHGLTERDIAKNKGVNHNAIHKRKQAILKKLHKILEK